MISHIVLVYVYRNRSYPIRLVMIIQFHFRCRADLNDLSHHCLVSTLLQTTHCPIYLDSLVSYSTEMTPIQLIMQLSCLLFMIDHILSDQSSQFNSNFGVNRIYMTSHVILLSNLYHILYLIGLITTVHFCFWDKVNLNDWSRHCDVSSSSYTTHYPIGLDSSVSYSIEITPM